MPNQWQGSHSQGFPAATRAAILNRDPVCRCMGCEMCGALGCLRGSTEADHINPMAQGGTDDLTNGRGMCAWCHQRKTVAEATAARLRAPRRARAAEPHPGLT